MKMRKSALAVVVVLCFALLCPMLALSVEPDDIPSNPFTDVKADAWYSAGVEYVYKHGLMNGTAEDKFSPDSSLTRAMLVTILYRYAEAPDTTALENPFNDVPSGTWYTDAVIWAAKNGIVAGYGAGKFGPDDALTREQLAAIIERYQKFSEKVPMDILMDREYPDWDEISPYAKSAVNILTIQGLFSDIPGANFRPQEKAIRAEVAVILQRFLEAVE
jgi:hypothetical protein